MKALIIYDDFAVAKTASAALQRATYHADVTVHWNISPWRADMLKLQSVAEEALMAAIDAHLIVLAGRCARSLPGWLKDWLERWAARRQIHDVALAVIGDGNAAARSAPATPGLFQFARRHGLSLIFDDRGVIKDGGPRVCTYTGHLCFRSGRVQWM